MIKILYFARLREALGTAGEELPPDTEVTTVKDIAALLSRRGGIWSEILGGEDGSVLVAVNQEMARPETSVKDGDEVAFFPPVTGG